MFPLFGDNCIITQEGPSWKGSRDLLRPQFVHNEYGDLEIFQKPINILLSVMPKEGIIDLQPLFFNLTLDITTAFLFGESVNSLETSESTSRTTFASAFNIAQDYIARRTRLEDFYWLIGGSQFKQACRDVHRFADQIIDRSLRDNKERSRYTFLDSIAKAMDRTALRSQIITILVAGRDTTAVLLSWTLYVGLALLFCAAT
jgi:cytochrome P450